MNMFGYVCMYIYQYAYICVWGGWESENMYLYIYISPLVILQNMHRETMHY